MQKLTLLILILLSGCVITNDRPTDVKVGHLEFLRISPFDQRFRVSVNIKNTSSSDLFVRTLDYKVMLNNLQITTGEEPLWRSIPAFSTRRFDLFFSTNIWGQLEPLASSVIEGRQVNYTLNGKLLTGSLFYQQVSYINYSDVLTQDQLPLKKLQKLQKLFPSLDL